jgi:hypothetical protein
VIYWRYFWSLIKQFLDNLASDQLPKLLQRFNRQLTFFGKNSEEKLKRNLKFPSKTCINKRGNNQRRGELASNSSFEISFNWSAPEEMGADLNLVHSE